MNSLIEERYFFKPFFSLKLCLFFALIFPLATYTQENSEKYLFIKNSNIISNLDKELKIDSLFSVYIIDKKFEFLANDLYDYAKWNYRNGALRKAIKVSNECINIIEGLSFFDESVYKRVMNNLGFFYGKNGDYYNAYKTFKKLTTLGKVDELTGDAYRLTGIYLRYLGDYYNAAEYFETSLEVAKDINNTTIFIKNSVDASINYREIATPQSYKRGVEILKKAIEFADSINTNTLSNKDDIPIKDMFMLYNHLGSLYNDRVDYDFINSKLNYDKSLSLAIQLKDSLLLSIVHNDLGYLYLQDKKEQAIYYLNKALFYKPDIRTASIIYANKSLYFLRLKKQKKAFENIQLSINMLTPVLINNFKSLPSKEAVSTCDYKIELLINLIDKAKIWLDFYDVTTNNKEYLINTLETLSLADYLVDIIRFESSEQQSKLFWRKTASEIYTNAVKTCFYLNKPEEGFYFMEKNKALLLLEDLSIRQQKEQVSLPDVLYKRQFYLKSQILKYNTQLNSNLEKKDSIRSLLLDTKEAYTYFIDSLQKDYKLYYKTQKPAQIITLNEAKKALSENKETYVEYILGNDDGFGMLINKSNTKFFKIKNYDKLLGLSEKFRELLERPLETKKDMENYNTVASSLYTSLFPKSISEEFANKKLIIIPDSYLQNIPFEALNTSIDLKSYFIKQNKISYAYSISFLHENGKLKRKNSKEFLGFAPVNFRSNLSNLPLSEQEVNYGTSLFSSDSFLYEDATKQNFIKNTKGYNIIHIASHSNVTDNKSPWIVFSDKKLTLDELYLTKNTADLVVLSACKTSLGNLNEGEGVMSLARGFFNTGANSVLSTLWNVNDKSSSKIIKEFYHEIKKGKTKSEALHVAKLNYLNNHQLSEQSPYYWASFILIGDSEKIYLSNNNTLFIIIILSITLLIISCLFYRKLKR